MTKKNYALELLEEYREEIQSQLRDIDDAISRLGGTALQGPTFAVRPDPYGPPPPAPVTFYAEPEVVEAAVEAHRKIAEAFADGGEIPPATTATNRTGEPEPVVTQPLPPSAAPVAQPAPAPSLTPEQAVAQVEAQNPPEAAQSPVLTAQENAQKMPGEAEPPWAAQERAAAAATAGAPTSGRRTNEQIAAENGVDLEHVKSWAKQQGVKRVTKDVIEQYAAMVRNGGAPGGDGAQPAPAEPEQMAGQQSIDDFAEDEPVVSAPPARPAEPTAYVAPVADAGAPQPMTGATPFKPPF